MLDVADMDGSMPMIISEFIRGALWVGFDKGDTSLCPSEAIALLFITIMFVCHSVWETGYMTMSYNFYICRLYMYIRVSNPIL